MSYGDVEQPPQKKRRFFHNDPELETLSNRNVDSSTTLPRIEDEDLTHKAPTNGVDTTKEISPARKNTHGFDKSLFESVVGQVPGDTLRNLKDVAGDDTERAINMYLDGSWQTTVSSRPAVSLTRKDTSTPIPGRNDQPPSRLQRTKFDRMPQSRYVGAFGVAAWATRSGNALVKHGETVKIERTKGRQTKMSRGGKPLPLMRQRADVIVRFTNQRGDEVGRLPKETASWVSSLVDQGICHFEGTCVFAPERVRINDTIYLQLRCSLVRRTFEAGGFVKLSENNRTTGVFEEKETTEEQDLRLRQVALVKLFEEINLLPCVMNEVTEKHKRQSILQAADVAEQYEKQDGDKKIKPANGGSSPPSEDDAEEGKELEQDQLDSLYKKAQSFDFDTPTCEPAETFVLDLRKYQKQALHWMMSKERNEQAKEKESSMHPLWEEYRWPVKDVDDKELPTVENQESFYVNPYSGELSLEFPAQEQHCLGGILADGWFLSHCFGVKSLQE